MTGHHRYNSVRLFAQALTFAHAQGHRTTPVEQTGEVGFTDHTLDATHTIDPRYLTEAPQREPEWADTARTLLDPHARPNLLQREP